MMNGTEGETLRSKMHQCGMYGKRVMGNFIMCTKRKCCVHRKCTKKKLSIALAQSFVFARCSSITAGTVATEKLCDGVDTAKGFCYEGDRFNFNGDSEAAVKAKTRIEQVKLRESGKCVTVNVSHYD